MYLFEGTRELDLSAMDGALNPPPGFGLSLVDSSAMDGALNPPPGFGVSLVDLSAMDGALNPPPGFGVSLVDVSECPLFATPAEGQSPGTIFPAPMNCRTLSCLSAT